MKNRNKAKMRKQATREATRNSLLEKTMCKKRARYSSRAIAKKLETMFASWI